MQFRYHLSKLFLKYLWYSFYMTILPLPICLFSWWFGTPQYLMNIYNIASTMLLSSILQTFLNLLILNILTSFFVKWSFWLMIFKTNANFITTKLILVIIYTVTVILWAGSLLVVLTPHASVSRLCQVPVANMRLTGNTTNTILMQAATVAQPTPKTTKCILGVPENVKVRDASL